MIVIDTGSSSTTKKPTKQTTTRQPTTQKPFESSTQAERCTDHFKGNSEDCNGYYECDNGHWINRHCASGLQWNAASNFCDWPQNTNCEAEECKLK